MKEQDNRHPAELGQALRRLAEEISELEDIVRLQATLIRQLEQLERARRNGEQKK